MNPPVPDQQTSDNEDKDQESTTPVDASSVPDYELVRGPTRQKENRFKVFLFSIMLPFLLGGLLAAGIVALFLYLNGSGT